MQFEVSSFRLDVWQELSQGPRERSRFVDSQLTKYIAFQIRAMRARRGWTQGTLGEKTNMNQNMIYRLENPSYGKPTISTLKRVAAAFDVALVVRFVPFRKLLDWVTSTPSIDEGVSSESLAVTEFDQEEAMVELGVTARQRLARRRKSGPRRRALRSFSPNGQQPLPLMPPMSIGGTDGLNDATGTAA
ncbi:MAG TPA: helix-turn-helix transcriptional regulator [Candidatus Acidoferrales bacterium]|jgi:transcriptional regulator with XRE-family HTH domain|nr:helix-turn-helix transcriptional regulator [Candidatus Acidoferrales bacterium]